MFLENIKLSSYSNYKIGGPARYFFEAENIEEIIKAVKLAHGMKTPIFILGGGTNILFGDEGFEGLVLKPEIRLIKKEDDGSLRVGAGVLVNELIDYLVENGLSGMEWAAGLPGTLGGAVRGNAGCFGEEMKKLVKEVTSLDISASQPKIIKRSSEECMFKYRSSIFKVNGDGEIIIEAVLAMKKGNKKLMKTMIERNINYRRERQPLEHPSIGSIFKNVNVEEVAKNQKETFVSVIKNDPFPVIPAAHLISEAGLKGISYGGAMISPKHPNFIVNVLNASSNDVKKLIQLVKKEVKNKFNINLREEITYLA